MSPPLWQVLLVSATLFLGAGGVMFWASVPHIRRSLPELLGRRTRARSSAALWLDLLYGSFLFLVGLFGTVAYLVWAFMAIRSSSP
jgi:hypothetical protein